MPRRTRPLNMFTAPFHALKRVIQAILFVLNMSRSPGGVKRLDLPTLLKHLEDKSGKKLKIDTFDDRLRIQKAIYLLGAMGHPGARRYKFGMYVHGPYSSDLAKDYYALQENKPLAKVVTQSGPRDETAEQIVAEAIQRGNKFLEATATLHKVRVANPTSTKEAVEKIVLGLKPHVKDTVGEAWTFLQHHKIAAAT